jgi:hypothetical protein
VAYEKLRSWHQRTSWPWNYGLWPKWTSLRFEAGQDSAEFVDSWQEALADLQASTDEITPFVQFHVFMEAISDHPDIAEFRMSLSTETYEILCMPTVIAGFLSHMSSL